MKKKQLSKIFTWYYILVKRLLKKPGFLMILLLIPILAIGLNLAADEEKSIVKVSLASKDKSEYAQSVIDSIDKESDLLSYYICETPEEAIEMVKSQKVDTAWILREDLEKNVNLFASSKNVVLADVYLVEDNTFVQSSREVLFGALFEKISYRMYENAVNSSVGQGNVSDEVLREEYNIFGKEDAIVAIKFLNSVNDILEDADYLTAPLRGLLSIVMLFCGIAAAMYFNNDDKKKIYSSISYRKRAFVMFGNNLAAMTIAGIAITISIAVSGIYTNFLYETLMMILLVLAATGFCSLLGSVFSSNTLLSAMLPSVLVLSIAFCPVFINFNTYEFIQAVLPPYYYLYGINDISYALPFLAYIVVTFALAYFIYTKKCIRKD